MLDRVGLFNGHLSGVQASNIVERSSLPVNILRHFTLIITIITIPLLQSQAPRRSVIAFFPIDSRIDTFSVSLNPSINQSK